MVGLSAVAVLPPFVAEGVVIVDNATEFDIAKMKASLAEAEEIRSRRSWTSGRMAIS
jgi:hypothetical protein